MLTLIHGDNPELSRNKLVELKHGYKEVRELNGKKLDVTELAQALSSSSLFGNDVVVVIEGFLTNAKKREKAFAEILTTILDATSDVILYEGKEIDKATAGKLGSGAKQLLFKIPVVLFQFLDTLTLPLLQQTLNTSSEEIVFALLLRRVRQLIQIKDNVTPVGLQSWQQQRLTGQTRHFTMDELIAMHSSLVRIDIAIKTGSSPFTLAQHLEQFIALL